MIRARPLVLFLLLALVQLAVPAQMIHKLQDTLSQGVQYRFRTAPVDPADPFRGHYVALSFEAERMAMDTDAHPWLRHGLRVYAPIETGADGYARLIALRQSPPERGDYLRLRVAQVYSQEVRLMLPFDRYYMDETLAPEAERAYWDSIQRQRRAGEAAPPPPQTYVTVRVRDGHAVLEELYLDDLPVRDYLRRHASSR